MSNTTMMMSPRRTGDDFEDLITVLGLSNTGLTDTTLATPRLSSWTPAARIVATLKIVPAADPFDGKLDICIVSPVSRWTVMAVLPRVFSGSHVNHPAVRMVRSSWLQIDTGESRVLLADGGIQGAACGGEPGFHFLAGYRQRPLGFEIAAVGDEQNVYKASLAPYLTGKKNPIPDLICYHDGAFRPTEKLGKI